MRRTCLLFVLLLLTGCPTDGPGSGSDADGDGHDAPADCNDSDADIHPGAVEICDELDNDCDGIVDAGDVPGAPLHHRDQDEDGYGSADGGTVQACEAPDGYTRSDDDCDDENPAVHPGADELCDGEDNDCNGEADAEGGEQDVDGDGAPACADCNDEDEDNHPGNEEICDGFDNDCDGEPGPDEGEDNDLDGFPSCDDCDDNDFERNPGAEEQCDERDNDCNGVADYGGDPDAEIDADNDGFIACAECDDDDDRARPGIQEECDGIDTDCSGDADFQGEPEVDVDGDGYWTCEDCDDDDTTVYDGATELCDGLDNDCNGATDFDAAGEIDGDNDGYPSCNDCLDGDPNTYPGAVEICDGNDNDCDGTTDIGYTAADLDGFGDRITLPPMAPTTEITVELWVWLDNLLLNGNPQERAVVSKTSPNGDDVLIAAEGGFDFVGELWTGSTTTVTAGTTASVFTWYHLAMTYDGAVQRFYVDGVEVGSTTEPAGLALSATGDWTLGARDDGAGLFVDEVDGMIDDVRIWDVARTAAEIDADRCVLLTGTEPGLVAYLPLDTDFIDLTGNGNDGTAVGDAVLLGF